MEYRDHFNNRITRTVSPAGMTTLWSDCIAELDGFPDYIPFNTTQHRIEDLPSETLEFLVASRYADSDSIADFAWNQFGNVPEGWNRVQAILDFVHERVTFGYKFGRPDKTARDVLSEKTGVCRDFAHLGVSLCRAMNIPARYASGYLGDIGVPDAGFDDFCAWFEVFLGGSWHNVDARYNTPRIGRIVMVRGRDAADVAMITSFGAYRLTSFRVWTTQVADGTCDADLMAMMQQLPDARFAPVMAMAATARF
jgi:transglutaminase-like putative cysteine protease